MVSQAVVNWVFFVGDTHVLRINRPDVETDDAYTERVSVPAARKAGVATPDLIVFDDSREIVDSVVTVYERVPGVALGRLPVRPEALPAYYRRLGAEIAHIHQGVRDLADPHGWLEPEEVPASRQILEQATRMGRVEAVTAIWLSKWLDRLEPARMFAQPKVFSHQDLHSFNVVVDPVNYEFRAVIDWGDAGWADPSADFCCSPLWAVPWLADGYESRGGHIDEGFFGRVLWDAVGTLLDWEDHPADEPWAPLTSSFWANLARLFRMDLDDRWRAWLPEVFPTI